jgi:hypothetical protein
MGCGRARHGACLRLLRAQGGKRGQAVARLDQDKIALRSLAPMRLLGDTQCEANSSGVREPRDGYRK